MLLYRKKGLPIPAVLPPPLIALLRSQAPLSNLPSSIPPASPSLSPSPSFSISSPPASYTHSPNTAQVPQINNPSTPQFATNMPSGD